MELLSLAQSQLHLDPAVLKIKRQRDQRDTVLHHAGLKLQDLPLVHQQAARPDRIPVKDVSVLIGADVHAPDKKLAVLDGAEAVLQVYLTGADGLDLRTRQLDPGFEAF